MNKREAVKKHGKERCQDMHVFLEKLDAYYGFPYSERMLLDLLGDLEKTIYYLNLEKTKVVGIDRLKKRIYLTR